MPDVVSIYWVVLANCNNWCCDFKKSPETFHKELHYSFGHSYNSLLNCPECIVDFSSREHDIYSRSRCSAKKTVLGFEPAAVGSVDAQLSRSPP